MGKYDSTSSTLEHIAKVGDYVDVIISELNRYKEIELIDNIDSMTVVDILNLLLHGESIPSDNTLLNSIYNNSNDYIYIPNNTILTQDDLLKSYIEELAYRKINHDKSKLEAPEKEYFDKCGAKYDLKKIDYNSEEYKLCLQILKPALEHHVLVNDHHPEHNKNGIMGMNIMNLSEMICDWKASSLRQAHSDIFDGIEKNQIRFNYDKKMTRILSNTVEKYFVK